MDKDPKKNIELEEENPNDAVTDDPATVQALIDAQESKGKRDQARNLARAAEFGKISKEKSPVKTWGYSIDHDDPVNGFTENPETINAFINKELEEHPSLDPEDKIEPIPQVVKTEKIESLAEAPEEDSEEAPEEIDEPEAKFNTTKNEDSLKTVFEKAQKIRDDYKDPGAPRYRLMSVAAANLWRIRQPEKATDRVDAINDAIEKAVKTAFGSDELDDYAKDTLDAVKMYFGETMIGDDADSVSIGTTETLVSSNGQIGDKSDIYGNLVVLRWIKNNINHVVAFSPREDTGIYALVDDSNGDSWKEKFLRAGAVNRDERKEIFTMDHDDHAELYHHEKTYEKVVKRMVMKELASIWSDEYEVDDVAKTVSSCGETLRKLAHPKSDDKVEMLSREEQNKAVDTRGKIPHEDPKMG